MKLIKRIKKGFTLVELVVVIAIIAILSGVSVAVYVGITDNAKQKAAVSEANSFGTVVRAAVLMDAEGTNVTMGEGASAVVCKVTWDSTLGIKIAVATEGKTFADISEYSDVKVLEALYKDVEKQGVNSSATIVESGEDSSVNGQIKEFTYKLSGKDATYNFLTGAAK